MRLRLNVASFRIMLLLVLDGLAHGVIAAMAHKNRAVRPVYARICEFAMDRHAERQPGRLALPSVAAMIAVPMNGDGNDRWAISSRAQI